MRKPMVVAAVTTAALALGLVGCSSNSGDDSGGGVTLTMVEALTSPDRTQLLRGILDDFEKANPGVKVNLISPPLSSSDQKIQQMLQTKQPADVIEVRDQTLATLTNNNWIMNIKPELTAWSGWADMTVAAQSAAQYTDGNVYFMPYGLFQKAMFYRTDLFKSAGIAKPPATWEDVLTNAKALTNSAENQYGYAMRGSTGSAGQFIPVVATYNANNLDLDKAFALKSGQSIFSTPAALDATKLYLNLFKEGSPSSSISWAFPEMVQGFTSGVAAMLQQDPEVIPSINESSFKDSYAVVGPPKGPDGKAVQGIGYAGWGVTQQTEHKAEALKLVQYLGSSAASVKFSASTNNIPVVKAAAQDPAFATPAWQGIIEFQSDPNVIAMPTGYDYPWYAEWAAKADTDFGQFLAGQFTPESLMANWDQYWTEKWASQ